MRYQTPDDPAAVTDDLTEVYAAVFAEPPYNEGPEQAREFAALYKRHAKRSGIGVVLARDEHANDRPAGFAYGLGQDAGWWWRHCDSPAPDDMAGATVFTLYEWAVLPSYRGQGIGRRLLTRLLESRPEPWTTLNVNPKADAYRIYRRTGWQRVGVARQSGWPEMAVMVRRT